MTNYFTNPVVFLIHTLCGLYITLLLLRFILQWAQVPFTNPVSQFVIKLTSPVLRPLRRVIPTYRGLDLSTLVVAWLVKSLELLLLTAVSKQMTPSFGVLLWSLPLLLRFVLQFFLFAVIARAILSWVRPDPYHPLMIVLERITSPILRPVQRRLPPIGGIDLSPMAVMIGLIVLDMLLLPPLLWLTATPLHLY